jgi:adenylate cyclase
MTRKVLIAQPDSKTSQNLSSIFIEWGDQVKLVPTLKDASAALQTMQPDLIFLDIVLLGNDWTKKIPILRQRFQNTDLVFTCHNFPSRSAQEKNRISKHRVLIGPFTNYGLRLALEQRSFIPPSNPDPDQRQKKILFPIRFKLTLPFLLLALVFTLAVSYLTTRIVFDTVEERFTNQLIEAGKLSSEWMVTEENRLLNSLRLVSNTSGISDNIQAGNAEKLRELTLPVAVNNQEEALILLDKQGISVLSMYHLDGGNPEDYEFSSNESIYSSHEIVQSVAQEEFDQFGDKFAGVIDTPLGSYFFLSGPVYHNGGLAGMILVGKSLQTLTSEMREATLAQTTIYNPSGKMLSTTFFSPRNLTLFTPEDIFDGQDEISYYQTFTQAGIDYTEILGPWEVRGGSDIGLIGSAIPQNYLVNTSWITRAQIFIALAVFILLIILIGSQLARRISQPITKLACASEEIAEGNLMVSFPLEGSDEITVLKESFNKMVQSLRESKHQIIEAYDSSLEGWSRALTLRDHQTDEHSHRVVKMTLEMASKLKIPRDELIQIKRGALLHDIGKVGIPDNILLKPGELDDWEWEIMKKHPVLAFEMLQPIDFLQKSLEIPLYHHEKWDGSGYPYGLKAKEIPLSARIFAVVDVYDALLTDRPYRKAWSRNQALQYISNNKGTHFDPEIVDIFLQLYGTSV